MCQGCHDVNALSNINQLALPAGRLSDRVDILKNLKYSPQYHTSVAKDGSKDGAVVCESQKQIREGSVNVKFIDKVNAVNLWLGQYDSYIDHLHDDLVQMYRRSKRVTDSNADVDSLSEPGRPTSNTPTAASVMFSIPYLIDPGCAEDVCRSDASLRPNDDVDRGDRSLLQVLVSAGKALDEREMFVRVTSSLGEYKYARTNYNVIFTHLFHAHVFRWSRPPLQGHLWGSGRGAQACP